jgi:GNAT superfamily N-acetyltransferase
MTVSYHWLDAETTRLGLAELADVYTSAFSAPPYNEPSRVTDGFGNMLDRHRRRLGFRLSAAFAGDGGRMIGFAYGYSSRPGQHWHDLMRSVLGADLAAHWLNDCFELVELAVLPERQHQGIGGELHDMLLSSVVHDRALLSTLGIETPARRLYRRRGWEEVVGGFSYPHTAGPFYTVLGLDVVQFTRQESA